MVLTKIFISHIIICVVLSFNIIHSCLAQDSPQDFLDAHNAARAEVKAGLPPLVWDKTVAAYAQNYANQRSGDCSLIHSSNSPYGENIAIGFGGFDMTAVQAVQMWVDEKQFYDYNSNTCNGPNGCLHYTQVVWKKTLRVGCAKVSCDNGGSFVICSYHPPGNFNGELPY